MKTKGDRIPFTSITNGKKPACSFSLMHAPQSIFYGEKSEPLHKHISLAMSHGYASTLQNTCMVSVVFNTRHREDYKHFYQRYETNTDKSFTQTTNFRCVPDKEVLVTFSSPSLPWTVWRSSSSLYPGSGHSVIGTVLDAHPDMVVAR